MMSELESRESAASVGRPLGWWLVTYLFYALALFFTLITAFPLAASSSDRIEVYLLNLAILIIFASSVLSIFIFRKILILLNSVIMIFWVFIFCVLNFIELTFHQKVGGSEKISDYISLLLVMTIPSLLFLTLTMLRFKNWSKNKIGD